jgi:uncharacterized membrane protein YozB (DUF420 family)
MNFPLLNATLNGLAAVLLIAGRFAIHRKHRALHERLMYAAFAASAAFLGCYLYYHFAVARGRPTEFRGTGVAKWGYLALLASHTLLAVVNLPMILRTIWLARHERWSAHKRLATWTFPLWLYVSVTGVLVYVVLYHFNPPAS